MPDRSRKDKQFADRNKVGVPTVDSATNSNSKSENLYGSKNPAAVELGRLGGLKGGKARAAKMTPEERRQNARAAAMARWDRNQLELKMVDRHGRKSEMNSTPAVEGQNLFKERTLSAPRDIVRSCKIESCSIYLVDCFRWMEERPANSIHAIVTDPPYGLVEFTDLEKAKLRNGRGGVWRIPPSFDGSKRSPLPRFTVLNGEHLRDLVVFFTNWAKLAERILAPGAHVFMATNPLLSDLICTSLRSAGLEKRGEIIRLVQTLRGGDRPKNAHEEFAEITVMPRSCFEPWVVFRKPFKGRVQDSLRKWKTGGLRRNSPEQPFRDVIQSSPTRREERALANHPALKPQAFMRQIVRAALPLGEGVVFDPFMGGGSTIAAALAIGYEAIGLENDEAFFDIAANGIRALAKLNGNGAFLNNDKNSKTSAPSKRT